MKTGFQGFVEFLVCFVLGETEHIINVSNACFLIDLARLVAFVFEVLHILLLQKIGVVVQELVELVYVCFLLHCTHLLFYFVYLITL